MRLSPALTHALPLVMALATSCTSELPPRGQVVLHLDTDAPLATEALFDRVLVEIFPPGERTPCDGCVRELPVDAARIAAGTFSFGFAPSPREVGYVARLRLFRSAGRGAPRPASTVELVGYLPAVAEDGVVHLTATFRTEDVGRPRGTLDAPVIFEKRPTDPSPPSALGTWALGHRTACERAAPTGAACVEGGPFFMGDPRVTVSSEAEGGAGERLVVLAPFFLDEHEVTVAELRATGLAQVDSRGRGLDPKDDLADALGACDYAVAKGPWDDRPVDCVSFQLARAVCRARGGDLPTEAQLEIVATARGAHLYPWGDADPTCSEAVVARGLLKSAGGCKEGDGLSLDTRVVPEAPGTGSRDRVGTIVDVAGNLAEWTRDAFEPDDGACWSRALAVDPTCEGEGGVARSVKGGDLVALPLPYGAARRSEEASDRTFSSPTVGFRCAYPAR